jgi:hypothetical protein
MQTPDTAEVSAQDYSVDQLRAMLEGGEQPKPEVEAESTPAEESETEDTSSDESETETETDQDSEPDTKPETKQERNDKGEFKESVQKRIDKAVFAQREAERRAADLERQLAEARGGSDAKPLEKPRYEAFQNDPKYKTYEEAQEAYTEAVAEFKLQQRDMAAAESARKESAKAMERVWNERLAATKAEHRDYDAVLAKAAEVPISAPAQTAIIESEVGPKILYELAKNPAEAERIAKLSPIGQVKAIARLEDKLSTPEAATRVTKAPKPPATVRGSAPKTVDLNDKSLSMRDFEREARRLMGRD